MWGVDLSDDGVEGGVEGEAEALKTTSGTPNSSSTMPAQPGETSAMSVRARSTSEEWMGEAERAGEGPASERGIGWPWMPPAVAGAGTCGKVSVGINPITPRKLVAACPRFCPQFEW